MKASSKPPSTKVPEVKTVPLHIRPTPDLVLSMFIDAVRRDNSQHVEKLHQGAFKLLQSYIEQLSESSNIIFCADIGNSIVNKQNFEDIRASNADQHVVKLYVYATVRDYLTAFHRNTPIEVNNKELFVFHVQSMGMDFPDLLHDLHGKRSHLVSPATVMTAGIFLLIALFVCNN